MGHRSWVRGRRARFSGPVRQARIRRSGQVRGREVRRSGCRRSGVTGHGPGVGGQEVGSAAGISHIFPHNSPCPMRFGTKTTFPANPNEKKREKTSRQRRGRESYGMGLIFINMRVLCSSAHRIPTYAGADNKALSSCLCPPRTP